MNRAKIWVFTLLVVGLGYLLVHSAAATRRADAVAALDARLASAAAHVSAALTAVGREASAVGALVARDEAVVAALRAPSPPAPTPAPPLPVKGKKKAPPPPPPAQPSAPDPAAQEARIRDAGRAAFERAEKALGFDLPQGTVVSAVSRDGLARKGDAAASELEAPAFLRGAAGGQARRGVLRQERALWYGAARPAGDGGAVLVLVPLDAAFAKRLATAASADVTVAVPDVNPVSTARPAELPLLQNATKLAGAGDVGQPGAVDVSMGPLKLPALPQPFAGGAPVRARAVPLEGVKGGYVVVSIPAEAAVNAPAAFLWRAVGGLALVLLLGLVVGLLVRSNDSIPQLPEPLLQAAARIEKGDFAARAPQLAGKLGTVAAALNRAAEVAGPALAAKGAPSAPHTTDEWYQGPLRPREEPRAPTPVAVPAAGPARTATAAAVPKAGPSMERGFAAGLPLAAAPAPGLAIEVDEESHWQQVFQDFLRTRASCGEVSEGLTYDKFRQKLEGNKAQLVSKYGCKTVRFQVYVKEGKAALKATPVK
jgi:hypothetical protein